MGPAFNLREFTCNPDMCAERAQGPFNRPTMLPTHQGDSAIQSHAMRVLAGVPLRSEPAPAAAPAETCMLPYSASALARLDKAAGYAWRLSASSSVPSFLWRPRPELCHWLLSNLWSTYGVMMTDFCPATAEHGGYQMGNQA